jgi:hypothetical protein
MKILGFIVFYVFMELYDGILGDWVFLHINLMSEGGFSTCFDADLDAYPEK